MAAAQAALSAPRAPQRGRSRTRPTPQATDDAARPRRLPERLPIARPGSPTGGTSPHGGARQLSQGPGPRDAAFVQLLQGMRVAERMQARERDVVGARRASLSHFAPVLPAPVQALSYALSRPRAHSTPTPSCAATPSTSQSSAFCRTPADPESHTPGTMEVDALMDRLMDLQLTAARR